VKVGNGYEGYQTIGKNFAVFSKDFHWLQTRPDDSLKGWIDFSCKLDQQWRYESFAANAQNNQNILR
jgi:hypothetical protein